MSLTNYNVIRELGRGSFAVVKEVIHRPTGTRYAMKVMEKKRLQGQLSGLKQEDFKEKVLSEARILKKMSHPNIIKFHDIIELEKELYLLMELVEGGELFDYVNKHGPFAEPGARTISSQLLEVHQPLSTSLRPPCSLSEILGRAGAWLPARSEHRTPRPQVGEHLASAGPARRWGRAVSGHRGLSRGISHGACSGHPPAIRKHSRASRGLGAHRSK